MGIIQPPTRNKSGTFLGFNPPQKKPAAEIGPVSSKTQLQAPAADWGEEADFAEVPTALPTDDEVRNRGKKPTQSYRNPSKKTQGIIAYPTLGKRKMSHV